MTRSANAHRSKRKGEGPSPRFFNFKATRASFATEVSRAASLWSCLRMLWSAFGAAGRSSILRYVVAALLIAMPLSATAQTQTLTSDELEQRSVHRRAVEAVIWGMPAVNTDLMLQEMLTKTSGKVNQVIYWGRLLDWHNQTLTPNPDAIYFMAFFNTNDVGPIVFEIPPVDNTASLTGNINTVWQTALEDVGVLGIDKGAGGKFVVVPPGYNEKIPDGYTVLRSDTIAGYALLRSTPKSHSAADIAAAIAYGKRVKLYPLSAAASPPETAFTDVKDVVYDSTIRFDASFFRSLDRIVQSEPWLERDRAVIDQLRSIGIEKGKPFAPDAGREAVLNAAAAEAHALLDRRYEKGWASFFPNTHWRTPGLQEIIDGQSTTYADRQRYPVDARGMMYTYGFIGIKRLGTAQFYLLNISDNDNKSYAGSQTYKMHVPSNAPMEQYWSVTAYDRRTHALIRNMPRASRASNSSDVKKNADGSIDIFFGPKAPSGKESNWVPTDPERGFELLFRIYGPTKEFFEKKWILPNVEQVAAP